MFCSVDTVMLCVCVCVCMCVWVSVCVCVCVGSQNEVAISNKSFQSNEVTWQFQTIKGTLMQFWKSPYSLFI